MYAGALFIQQALHWDLYIAVAGLLAITAVYTVAGTWLSLRGQHSSCSASRSAPRALVPLTGFLCFQHHRVWGELGGTYLTTGLLTKNDQVRANEAPWASDRSRLVLL